MRGRIRRTMLVGLALVLSLFSSNFLPVMTAYAAAPDPSILDNCKDLVTENANGWGSKIDTVGDPATVTVYADDGYLIDKYCVKAGSGAGAAYIQQVVPPSATVVIDHNLKDSVSHYVIHQIPAPEEVTPVAPIFTPPTCDAAGTLIGVDTSQYVWIRSGTDSAAVLTAQAVGNVTLTGQTVYGPHDLTQLTGPYCEEEVTYVSPVITPAHQTSVCVEGEEVFTSGSVTFGSVEGLHYWIDGSEVSGTVNLEPGTYSVALTTDEGYKLADGVTTPVSVTINAADELECVIPDTESVTLCHATHSEKNPYVRITVDAAGAFNGHLDDNFGGTHGDHQNGEDIIPPFYYNGQLYSQNWNEETALDCPPQEELEPATPTAIARLVPCVPQSNTTDQVVVSVTNTYDATDDTVTYTVTLGAQSKTITLADGASGNVTFSGVPVGTYTATVTGDDSTSATVNAVTVKNCAGGILGDNDVCPNIFGSQTTIPSGYAKDTMGNCVVPTTTTTQQPPQVLGTSTALPAALPATGPVESSLNFLYAIMTAIVTYGAVYFLQGKRDLAR